jgi:hypothetical protein
MPRKLFYKILILKIKIIFGINTFKDNDKYCRYYELYVTKNDILHNTETDTFIFHELSHQRER